jgi:serine phosphatase RsbU (regulator of sigma subunit)
MTAMCVALDPKSGAASVVGAGHPPLLIARRDGGTEAVRSSAPPLGVLDSSDFPETPIELAVGDAFLLYTDGLYGAEQVYAVDGTPVDIAPDARAPSLTAHALLTRVIEQANAGNGDTPLPDDLAAVAVKRRDV